MGHAASQPVTAFARARGFPRPRGERKHGGSLRSGAQSGLSAALFVSGLWLWLRPGAGAVLWLHLAGGAVLAGALLPWLAVHVPQGLARSERRAFTLASWALLAVWLVLLLSGLAMALPAALWLAGTVWFPPRAVTEALSFAHYWSAWASLAGLVLHLWMRHWRRS
jgi:hypothetical protein